MMPAAINYKDLLGNHWLEMFFLGLFFTLLFGMILIPFIYRRYLSVRYRRAFVISLLTLMVAYIVEFHHCAIYGKYWETLETNPLFFFHQCLTPGLLILFFIPFAYRILTRWWNPSISEHSSGYAEFREWLGPANLVCLLVIAFTYTASYDFWNWNQEFLQTPYRCFLQVFFGGVAVLSIYPIFTTLKYEFSKRIKTASNREDPSAVQNKILDLLANGKISPQECADLLSVVYKRQETSPPSNNSSEYTIGGEQPPDPPTASESEINNESIV